jgi:hypothetical protein
MEPYCRLFYIQCYKTNELEKKLVLTWEEFSMTRSSKNHKRAKSKEFSENWSNFKAVAYLPTSSLDLVG